MRDGPNGYTVGTLHPTARRRQWHALSEREVADLADAMVYSLKFGLRVRDVAGADQAHEWQLAQQIRQTIVDHHRAAARRWLEQQR
ncbi:MAG: hypothetical protein RIC56_03810 [Pseudomonadales bacterium]